MIDSNMSISSTLIRACMNNIQKELRQLEHWLNTLPDAVNHAVPSQLDESHAILERLSKQYDVQQHALNHIIDRLDVLEEARAVRIDDEPWTADDSTCLENMIIDPLEPIYHIHKSEDKLIASPPPIDTLSSAESAVDMSVNKPQVSIPAQEEQKEPVPVKSEVEPLVLKLETKEDSVEEEEVEEEASEEAEPAEEVEPEEAEPAEEAEAEPAEEAEAAEEEDDGIELSEITYKGKAYYKDPEGFIYGIDEDSQPTEQPIGVWKEKSSSIAFYQLK